MTLEDIAMRAAAAPHTQHDSPPAPPSLPNNGSAQRKRGQLRRVSLLAAALAGLVPGAAAQETKNFVGSIYGEAGKLEKTFDARPLLLNVMAGYNVLHREGRDKLLLLPNVRIMPRGDNPEAFWGNYMDIGVGPAYQHAPFIAGAEVARRVRFKDPGVEGTFFRVWSGYWNRWQARALAKSKAAPMRPWAIGYGEAEFNSLKENPRQRGNLIADFKTIGFLDVADIKGTIISPYFDGKVNMDARNRPWNRYGQVEGGLSVRKGPVQFFVGYGDRRSFNRGGVEGQYFVVKTGVWWPLGF